MLGWLQVSWLNTSSAQHNISFITSAVLIYKWSPGTGYHKNKPHQNYTLGELLCSLLFKMHAKARHRLLSNFSSQILLLLHYVSLWAVKIWSLILTYTKATLIALWQSYGLYRNVGTDMLCTPAVHEMALVQNAAQDHKCLTKAHTQGNQS